MQTLTVLINCCNSNKLTICIAEADLKLDIEAHSQSFVGLIIPISPMTTTLILLESVSCRLNTFLMIFIDKAGQLIKYFCR